MATRPFFLVLGVVVLCLSGLSRAEDTDAKILERFMSEFVELTPGKGKFPASFVMGSSSETAPASEKPPVTIRFTAPFAMARYEVTQELWGLVMGKNPSRWRGPRNSAEMMSWDEAKTFCERATRMLRERKLLDKDQVIRLPSEAEWEYACRAGSTTDYCFGDSVRDLGAFAWFIGNSKGEDPPVGRKKANAWGLYDMHGYIWEWCEDVWEPSLKDIPADGGPRRDAKNPDRVMRGGSWADPADQARSAYRGKAARDSRNDRIGFRCVKAKKEDRP